MGFWKFYLNDIEVEEPIGWDAIEFTAKRTDEHGVDQPFSTEVTFYDKGARLLKSYYDTEFINAEIAIRIVSNQIVGFENYEFNGFINMALYSEHNVCDTDTWQISVGIIDDNFREKFKSRMDVDVDIYANYDLDNNPIPSPTFQSTRLHTQEVYLVGFARNTATEYPIDVWATLFWTYDAGWNLPDFSCVIPAYFSNSDFKGPFGSTFDPVNTKWSNTNVCFKNNGNFTRTITFSVRVTGQIQWTINGMPGDTADAWLFLSIYDGDGNYVGETYLGSSPIATYLGAPVAFDIDNTYTGDFPPDYSAIIQFRWGGGGNINPDMEPSGDIGREIAVWFNEVCLSVTEKNKSELASFSETMYVENFLRRLIHIITGSSDGLISDTFSKAGNGCYWNHVLTNGLKLRNAKTARQAAFICDPNAEFEQTNFQVTFKKLFESLSAIFCLGWTFEKVGSEWKVRIEKIDYFYQNQINFTAIDVGEVTQAALTDKLSNQFVVGYDATWKNTQLSGLWAVHTSRNYYVNNRAMAQGTTKKTELLSGIIAEGCAIEFSRRMFFYTDDSGSSDRPNDYDLFIIWVNRNVLTITNVEDSEYALPPSYGESGTITIQPGEASMSSRRITTSNSEVGDIYNIFLSPGRNVRRWWKVIGMHTYGLANPVLQYQTGQYQVQYSSFISDSIEPCQEAGINEVIYENGSISQSSLREQYRKYLFKPIQINFDYPQSLCEFINLAVDNPYGKVKLKSGSLMVSGYITEIKNQPEDDSGGTTSFVLLASNIADPEPEGNRAYSNAYSSAYL